MPKDLPYREPTDIEVAYVAGFFPGIGPRWNPYTDEEKAKQLELRRKLHAVNSWRDRPLKEDRVA